MQREDIPASKGIASCLIEHLVWNTPADQFGNSNLSEDLQNVLAHTFNNTCLDNDCKQWGEVSELIYLFHPAQPWTRQSAHNFVAAAWDYVGFG